jgi:hypothetical protein
VATAVASGLQELAQESFAAGMVRNGVREAIGPTGAYDLTNVLLNDAGRPYRRGGSGLKSNAGLDSSQLVGIWDGNFLACQRTVFGTAGGTGTNGKLAVLSADDATPITLVSGLTFNGPFSMVKVGNYLAVPINASGVANVILYAGSRKTASYSTGTVSISSGSRVLTGVGTSWAANIDPGMMLTVTGFTKKYTVSSVQSDTSLTLDTQWTEAGAAGAAYSLAPTRTVVPSTLVTASTAKLASVAGRLAFTAGNYVGLSDIADPFTFSSGNFLRLPGGTIALANAREQLLIFHTGGLSVAGGLANATPSDPAGNPLWSLTLANAELIALGHEGIASYSGRVIVPCFDAVWMVDPTSGPTNISKSIRDLYLGYADVPGPFPGGAAVAQGHYLLPIVSSVGVAWMDTLVCRLDSGAWTRLAGSGAKVTAYARRSTLTGSALLGADNTTGSRVLGLSYFEPSTSAKNDYDGTAHQASITTRDFTAGEQPTFFKKLRVVQEGTVDSGSPTVSAFYRRLPDTPGTGNFVTNPSFETDTSGWAVGPGGVGHVNAATSLTRVTTAAYSGAASLQVVNPATANVGIESSAGLAGPFLSGTPYTFSFLARSAAGAGTLRARVIDLPSLDSAQVDFAPSTEWQVFSVTWTPSANRTNVFLQFYTPGGTAGTWGLDAVQLVQGSSAPSYFDGDPLLLKGSPAGQGLDVGAPTAIRDSGSYTFWNANKRGKAIRFTITTTGALSTWILHRLAVFFRQQGRQ